MELKAYLHKVQYYETDQMGIVHHSNYIRWFEEARVDYMEQIGADYSIMEQEGYISPVVSINCNYKTVTKFGEHVYIITKLEHFENAKFSIVYTIVDAATKQVKAIGESKHCFINKDGKIISLKKENKKYFELFSDSIGKETKILDDKK
ncbi:putative esterase [Clostridium saccharobutylicum]|uniref:acyl-CoA thioesterase n=1 Tax=Clostridium saccharobutylicum TaxID=169679 RepID=UPI000983A6C6|nr:thioesterase family protein [Clostridium saccharobutylicum]AQS09915.1 putative esterase [Clostridium saccharobutylicum]MBC2438529.1 acyl-CoA thioesterase [Clostridium saccharobutylicum]NSB90891.1 acyl-CoA thioester hydrolase [Clostridium saccharobutylicum]NYC27676.1 acyl-CoA thioester hydrolase [Clostridium saccharobutylicum]OOM12373.1 putative esterase [Clostridium saccharobutylicum]